MQALTQEVVTSSAIEGEALDQATVRSSIARRLGVDIGVLAPADRHVDGVVDMVLDATQHHAEPLQVVSGPVGREKVHYEALPANRLAQETAAFLDWFNAPGAGDALIHAGLAHLWLVTLLPVVVQ